ncbi:MAG: VanZ family protein [Planctomycetota bacterium]|nr:VanZ family protein [Planctomycetota bacterium]
MAFLTFLLLAEDPWSLFRAFPNEATRILKHGVIDKVYHLLAYFSMTCVLMWYAATGTRRTFYGVAAAVTLHAFATELLQHFVPERTADIDDLIANLMGVAAGVVAGMLIRQTLPVEDAENKHSLNAAPTCSGFDLSRRSSEDSAASTRNRSALFVPGVIARQAGRLLAARSGRPTAAPSVVAGSKPRFDRLAMSADQIAEVQRRELNYRMLGIVGGISALVLVSTYAVHGWQVQRSTGMLVHRAREAVAAGDTTVALNCFQQYCEFAPNDVNALAEYALLRDDQRQRPAGGKSVFMLFERVLRRDPRRDDVRRRQVATAIELERYPDALSHLKVLRQSHPKEGLLDYQAGLCHERIQDLEAAAEAFQEAIDDAPEMIEPWEHLARIQYEAPNQAAAAEQLVQRLVQVNSKNADAWIARARFRLWTQQFEQAGQDIEQAVALAPDAYHVLRAVGDVGTARAMRAKSESRLPLAERIAIETGTLLTRGAELHPQQRDLMQIRIVLEAEFGSLDRAFTLASGLLIEETSLPADSIHELMAGIAIDHGRTVQAAASLDRLPRTAVTDGQRLRLEAAVAMSESRWDDAVKLLKEARQMLAHSPSHLLKVDLTLATCLAELGNVDDQLVVYRQVLKYKPQSIEARVGLASTLASAGQYPEALAEYRQLVHLPQVRLELARHLIEYNWQFPDIARDWREVMELLDRAELSHGATVETVLLRAEVLVAQSEFDEARQLVLRTRRENPENRELLAMLTRIAEQSRDEIELARLKAQTLELSDNSEDVERQLRLMLLETPDDGDSAITLMRHYLQQNRTDQALATFQKHAPQMDRFALSRTYEVFGDVTRATGLLEQELHDHPTSIDALWALSDLLIRHDRGDRAEPLLEHLLKLQPNVSNEIIGSSRRRLAVILAKKQHYRAFQRAVALMDQNAAQSSTLATDDLRAMSTVFHFSPQRSDRLVAIGLLENVDDRGQMLPEDRWQLANLYREVGLTEKAAPQFHRAAASGLVSPAFLREFVVFLIESGELLEAGKQLSRLAVDFPQADRVRLQAVHHAALGHSDKAIAVLDEFVSDEASGLTQVNRLLHAAETCQELLKSRTTATEMALSPAVDRYLQAAVDADPNQVKSLVVWLLDRDRDVEAFELLETVWQHLPSETAANLSLAMLRSGSNRSRRDRVEQYLVAGSREQPKSLELKLCLADLKSLGEQYSEAEDLYREILLTDARHVPALNSLAWGLAMRGRLLDEASTFVERAIDQAGPVPQLMDTRGCVKLAQSRLRSATDDFLVATDAGGDPTTFLHLALVQAESGNVEQADATLKHAIEVGLRAAQLHPFDRELLVRLKSLVPSGGPPSLRTLSEQSALDL